MATDKTYLKIAKTRYELQKKLDQLRAVERKVIAAARSARSE